MENNDCPICLEPMVQNNDNCCMNGTNCEHKFCIPCYCRIVEDNKCAICRAELEDKEDNDSDDSDNDLWDGNNNRPTNDLFMGRRWFNTETNKIEYFFVFIDNIGFTYNWVEVEKKSFTSFIQKYSNGDNIEGCCYVCGIQRTAEVNEFMKNKYPNGFLIGDDDSWDDYFIEGYNNCYECYNMFVKLNEVFYN